MSKIIATLKYLLLELTSGAILLCILPRGIFEWSAPTALLCPVHHTQQRDNLLFSGPGGDWCQNSRPCSGPWTSKHGGHDHSLLITCRAAAVPRRCGVGGYPVPIDNKAPAATWRLTARHHPLIRQGSPQAFAPW